MEHFVSLPLGTLRVRLERSQLNLGERGGFEASWATDKEGVSSENYRSIVKDHLRSVYRQREGGEPGSITLNLASHQLMDDLIGWTKLNYREIEDG